MQESLQWAARYPTRWCSEKEVQRCLRRAKVLLAWKVGDEARELFACTEERYGVMALVRWHGGCSDRRRAQKERTCSDGSAKERNGARWGEEEIRRRREWSVWWRIRSECAGWRRKSEGASWRRKVSARARGLNKFSFLFTFIMTVRWITVVIFHKQSFIMTVRWENRRYFSLWPLLTMTITVVIKHQKFKIQIIHENATTLFATINFYQVSLFVIVIKLFCTSAWSQPMVHVCSFTTHPVTICLSWIKFYFPSDVGYIVK